MSNSTFELENKLKKLGFSQEIINAAWPKWWSNEAELSPSAFNDLKFSLSRKLGLSPESLFQAGEAKFVWKGNAKFKGLGDVTSSDEDVLTSFGISLCRVLVKTSRNDLYRGIHDIDPILIRKDLLQGGVDFISLSVVLSILDHLGIPVIYIKKHPLGAKRMDAMAVKAGGRFAILVAKESLYEEPVMFSVAHELGHIVFGHLDSESSLIDREIEGEVGRDEEERQANLFAMALLTGMPEPKVEVDRPPATATELARAVLRKGKQIHVQPGLLALAYGFQTGDWQKAYGALKRLHSVRIEVWKYVNQRFVSRGDMSRLSSDNLEYLENILGVG